MKYCLTEDTSDTSNAVEIPRIKQLLSRVCQCVMDGVKMKLLVDVGDHSCRP